MIQPKSEMIQPKEAMLLSIVPEVAEMKEDAEMKDEEVTMKDI